MKTTILALVTVWMAAAQQALPNPEILRQQAEAQERDRAIARRLEWQMERAKRPEVKAAADKAAAKAAKRKPRRKSR